jgi:hypothetical protein
MKRLSYDTIMRLKLWRMPVHGMFPKFFWYRVWQSDIYICNFFGNGVDKMNKSLNSNLWFIFEGDESGTKWKCLMPQECIEETDLFNEIIKLKSCQSTSH